MILILSKGMKFVYFVTDETLVIELVVRRPLILDNIAIFNFEN